MIKMKTMFIGTLFIVMISSGSMNAFATNEQVDLSEYSITYNDEISKDTSESCKVLISIPYSYSDTIPKEPQKPVQTGDDSNVVLYGMSAILSGLGMIVVGKKRK